MRHAQLWLNLLLFLIDDAEKMLTINIHYYSDDVIVINYYNIFALNVTFIWKN